MNNRYGTTSDMIVREVDDNGTPRLIAVDANGLYLTTRDRVDRLTADVNRYGVSRDEVNRKLETMGFNPLEMFNSHKHLIKTDTETDKGKALNPIKASKRLNPIKASKRGF